MGKPGSRSESTTKADRKFEKKLDFYAKVREAVSTLGAQKAIVKKKKLRSRQKILKAYDLSSFAEFLPELKDKKPPTPALEFKLNCKNQKKLVLKEGKQMETVLNHPTFKSDPLAAIQQHLERTQPMMEVKLEKRKNKSGSKKRKEKKSKAFAGPQSMDM